MQSTRGGRMHKDASEGGERRITGRRGGGGSRPSNPRAVEQQGPAPGGGAGKKRGLSFLGSRENDRKKVVSGKIW